VTDREEREVEQVQRSRRKLELKERPLVTPDPVSLLFRVESRLKHLKTRGNFARDFLPMIGAPITTHTMVTMMAWMQAEGDAGIFNPLNTTEPEPGSTDFNWVHVQNYLRYLDGLKATAKTLNFGADHDQFGYAPIRHGLRKNARAATVLAAVESSAWGTGGLALHVLEATGWQELQSNAYLHHRLSQ
jgi:hypothetical protein